MIASLLWIAAAQAADWAALDTDSGWTLLSEASTADTGPIQIHTKTIGGVQCLRGVATVDVPGQKMYDAIVDIPSAKKWSSETLIEARVLGRSGKSIDYYEHLDVPGWTMASDRFWVLRGEDASSGSALTFRWDRFDWKAQYPDLAKELATNHPDSVEPSPNWGAWSFVPEGEKTKAKYYICSDAGGSLPTWLKESAATKTLPGTVADLVREGRRRAKG